MLEWRVFHGLAQEHRTTRGVDDTTDGRALHVSAEGPIQHVVGSRRIAHGLMAVFVHLVV